MRPTKSWRRLILDSSLTLTVAFALVSSCLGQMNGEPLLVSQVLAKAHVNGSLSYWGRGPCSDSSSERYPPAPGLRGDVDTSGPIGEVLQKMFADDPKMRVTQEPGGIVRMSETDVPRDLLDIRIHRISFDVPGFHGPNMAIRLILSSPEVESFRKLHKIGPLHTVSLLPSDAGRNNPSVSGSLDDVTVSQALDYIFGTFSGLWIYGNCPNGAKGEERNVYFWFFRTFESNQ